MGTEDFRRIGTGPHAVIGLHGWFGSSGAWQPIFPALDRQTFSYFFPDYRGYGARVAWRATIPSPKRPQMSSPWQTNWTSHGSRLSVTRWAGP